MEFQVLDNMAYLSHLELMKVFRQAFRRSGLKVSFSEGFNPHMKLSFAIAKGVGLKSSGELLEIEVQEDIDINKYFYSINNSLPEGLKINIIKNKGSNKKSLSAMLKKARYSLSGDEDTLNRVWHKLEVEDIMVHVKTKRKEEVKNLKEYIASVEKGDGKILITVFAGSEKNLRIEYLLNYLSENITVKREKLLNETQAIIDEFSK